MADIEYLEEERKKLWAEVTKQNEQISNLASKLEKTNENVEINKEDIANKITDDEKSAKQASKDASMYRNRTKTTAEEANTILNDLKNDINNLKQIVANCEESKRSITLQNKNIENKNNELAAQQNKFNEIVAKMQPLTETVNKAQDILAQLNTLKTSVQEKHDSILELEKRSESLVDKTTTQNAEVTKLKNQIAGYKQLNKETNEEEFIDGLKQELEQTYDELSTNIETLEENIKEFQKVKTKEVSDFISSMQAKYDELIKTIEGLLPRAMSAGLSSAYQEKRVAEEKERTDAMKSFKSAIIWMFAVAIIPVGITCYLFFYKHFCIQAIINDTPKIMSAVLALYAPIFWLAYSANKRMNLSKRLIEEYTYKESLSKTFEGLSKQIENIDNEELANDLKAKLMYIVVSMNSENPGKLIRGYNKPDHPIMDIINNSVKLTDSLQNLAQVPGLNILCNHLSKAVENQKELRNRKAQFGLDVNEAINKKDIIEEDGE